MDNTVLSTQVADLTIERATKGAVQDTYNLLATGIVFEMPAVVFLLAFVVIRLAPGEPHLYLLRGHVHSLLGDESSAQSDYARAAAVAGEAPQTAQ